MVYSDTGPDTGPNIGSLILQRLILPDPAISGETGLYVQLNDLALLREPAAEILFLPGGVAVFDTYMNLFNLGTWTRHCQLDGLALHLSGEGRCHLHVWRTTRADVAPVSDGSHRAEPWSGGQLLFQDTVTLALSGIVIALDAALTMAAQTGEGLIMFRLTALAEARLTQGAFVAPAPAQLRPRRLAISITTFRREAAVADTAARVVAFLAGEGGQILARAGTTAHLFIVDNGQSAAPTPHPALTLIANPNLGGAGGFARGLAAAQDGGFSHCLFMDDDAAFEMENLLRTAAFLQLARSPRAAVAGAMISAARPFAMWENGAVFDRLCRPLHSGTDLRDPVAVAAMELAAARRKPAGFYGGWWYFAFPLDQVRHYPFPFFVRGDDISFSLAHRFDTATLSGVVSFQEDFSAKESPLTLYLDLRNHLHHHMVQPDMQIGANGTARIVLRFLLRSLVRMHYDSADAQLMAWEDVMAGPDFFAQNADMQAKRGQIAALTRTEIWRPVTAADLALPVLDPTPPGQALATVLKYTLNGHLVPLWRLWGSAVRVPVSHRGLIWPFWGRGTVCFTNADESRAYVVRHDKGRAFGILRRAARMYLRWRRVYPGLAQAHRDGYASLAARRFWQARFVKAGPDAQG